MNKCENGARKLGYFSNKLIYECHVIAQLDAGAHCDADFYRWHFIPMLVFFVWCTSNTAVQEPSHYVSSKPTNMAEMRDAQTQKCHF